MPAVSIVTKMLDQLNTYLYLFTCSFIRFSHGNYKPYYLKSSANGIFFLIIISLAAISIKYSLSQISQKEIWYYTGITGIFEPLFERLLI